MGRGGRAGPWRPADGRARVPPPAEGAQGLARFADRWDPRDPALSSRGRADWDRRTGCFASPPAIRRALYPTNAIESLPAALRKVVHGRGAFPQDASIIQRLSLGLHHVAKQWTQPMPEWHAALTQCVILFGERVQV